MFIQSLENNRMFQLLAANPSQEAKAYYGMLFPIAAITEEMLEYIKNVFPSFTSHGFSHSLRILDNIYLILSKDLRESLTPPELFCLIMAAMFHDMGMADPNRKDRYEQRVNHHLYAEEPLKKFMDEHLTLIKERNRLFNCILFTCEAHGMTLEAFYSDPRFYNEDMIGGYVLRFSLLGVLLRIGDLLDMDENRTSNFIRRFYPSYFPDDSVLHHERHELIELYSLLPEQITLKVLAKNIDEHHIWEGWLHYLNEELLHANADLLYRLNGNFRFPHLQYEIKPAPGSEYQTEEMRFELTDEGAIWNILSQSVYTEEYDFIRELVQNGIDSVLMRSYIDPTATLPYPSPRSWGMWQKSGQVVVAYSEHGGLLIVSDTGTGMDLDAVKSFLFRIADSGYRHQKDCRSYPFPSIAKFGIGFISCLSKCEEINLFTQAAKDAPCYKIRLFSNSIRAYFEETESVEDCGTTICVKLKRQYSTEDVNTYLFHTFPYPSVPVKWINLDTMEEEILNLCKRGALSQRPGFDPFYTMPYLKFAACYEIFENARNQVYLDYERQIGLLQDGLDSLESAVVDWKRLESRGELEKTAFQGQLIFLMRSLKNKEPFADTQKILANFLQESQTYSKSQFKLEISSILDKIATGIDALSFEKFKIQNQMNLFASPKSVVGAAAILPLLEDSSAAICLSEDFDIIGVAKESHGRSQLSRSNCGLILIQCVFDDWSAGIEWRSLHGFLFNHGSIVNALTSMWTEDPSQPPSATVSLSWLSTLEQEYGFEDVMEDQVDKRIFEYYKDSTITTHYSEMFLSRSKIYIVTETQEESYNDLKDFVEKSSERKPPQDYIEDLILDWEMSSYAEDENPFDQIKNTDNIFSQDGIKIEFDSSKIVPLGICKAQVNLSAGARFDLNVGRRYIDESHGKIDSWLANTGNHIQEEVSKQLITAIESYGLSWDSGTLCGDIDSEDYFERKSKMQIGRTLKRMEGKVF